MSTEYCLICAIIMAAYLNLINSASIPLRPTYKPSILLLPPGFDSQKPPLQPLLYPFSVSSPSASPTRSAFKSVSRTTADWIPLGFNVKDLAPIVPYSTPSLSSRPIPALEDRISYHEPEEVSPSYSDGPVFESIVYGTWKPDPPLQPAIILNETKPQQQKQQNVANGRINSSSKSGFVVDGKVYNKTINRQHGGFIGHIQPKPIKVEKQQLPKYQNEKLSTSSSIEYKSRESTEMSSEQKLQRKLKKQGRQKIRPISSSTTQQTVLERDTNREDEEESTTITTTTISATIKENNPQQLSVIKVNSTDPKLMEVVKQINDSIEIRYNHKQTPPHSNDMMTPAAATTSAAAESAATNTNNNDYDDIYKNNQMGVLRTQSVTESTEFMSPEPLPNYEDDAVNILDNISATRRSWPTDFMDESLSATDAINTQPDYSDLFGDNNETDPSDISLALSALNIPPSLWPKLPGNITKLGTPYEAKSSAEEPALCVPITVKEQNVVNSKELVFIERVFCFPMPPSTTPLGNSGSTSRSKISNNVIKAKVQDFDEYIDSKSMVSNVSTSNFKSQLYLVTTILVIYFKFIV